MLLLWVSSRNSVAFDEGFHVSSGVVALARHDFVSSFAGPPLVRMAAGAAALAAGAKLPDVKYEQPSDERLLAEGFMRANAAHFHDVFRAARLVTLLCALALAWLVWRTAQRFYGPLAGVVALAVWTLLPEALAHGALVGLDVPNALVFFGGTLAAAAWLRTGRWSAYGVFAAWWCAAFLVRFNAPQLFVIVALLALVLAASGRLAAPRHALAGFALLPFAALLALAIGYQFQGIGAPLGPLPFASDAFRALAHRFPSLPSPLPVPYLFGLDDLAFLSQPGLKASYLLGEVTRAHDWRYFPIAVAAKWPLGLFVLIVARLAVHAREGALRAAREWTLLVPVLVIALWSMATNLDYGVRYLLPLLPFLCVWVSGLAAPLVRGARRAGAMGVLLACLGTGAIALESARALPYPLAFFNTLAGGPGRGDRIVNDSNVDWGQGLIALRDELRALHIGRVHLAYHGMVDPTLYGIDAVPYAGGMPDTRSDYLVVSSYFLVGLPARTMTAAGSSPQALQLDMGPLKSQEPLARPAGCLYLFRIR